MASSCSASSNPKEEGDLAGTEPIAAVPRWERPAVIIDRDFTYVQLEVEEIDRSKALYICISERKTKEGKWAEHHTIKAIKLSDLFSETSSHYSPLPLRQVACQEMTDYPSRASCGVYGSQIFFSSGRYIYVYDTDTNHDGPDSAGFTKIIPGLPERKIRPLLVELARKLYALDFSPGDAKSFEVYDPKEGIWSPLPLPPTWVLGEGVHLQLPCFAVTGTKIYYTIRETPAEDSDSDPNTMVFCFDVSDPNREWRQIPAFFWSTLSPDAAESPCPCIPFDGTALIMELNVGNDDLKLMLTYSYGSEVLIEAYLLSSSEEKARLISSITEDMTKLPLLNLEFKRPRSYKLVDLGSQRACLILSSFERTISALNDPKMNNLVTLVIPFKILCNTDCSQFKFIFFPTCYLKNNAKTDPLAYCDVYGCFVLPAKWQEVDDEQHSE
ncbi:hypothetical protein ABKV19_005815 [Rosa sericea]